MMKLVYILLLLVVFLVGCSIIEQEVETLDPETIILPNGTEIIACTPHFGCVDSVNKGYQLANCSWVERSECNLGCYEGDCREPKVCERGFKCINEKTKGLQVESCEWMITQDCDWGCLNGECQNETSKDIALPLVKTYQLPLGSEDLIEFRNQQYVLGIVDLKAERVRIEINGRNSDWLKEGNSFVHGRIKVEIVDILFQPYEGGIQAITYKVGDS